MFPKIFIFSALILNIAALPAICATEARSFKVSVTLPPSTTMHNTDDALTSISSNFDNQITTKEIVEKDSKKFLLITHLAK